MLKFLKKLTRVNIAAQSLSPVVTADNQTVSDGDAVGTNKGWAVLGIDGSGNLQILKADTDGTVAVDVENQPTVTSENQYYCNIDGSWENRQSGEGILNIHLEDVDASQDFIIIDRCKLVFDPQLYYRYSLGRDSAQLNEILSSRFGIGNDMSSPTRTSNHGRPVVKSPGSREPLGELQIRQIVYRDNAPLEHGTSRHTRYPRSDRCRIMDYVRVDMARSAPDQMLFPQGADRRRTCRRV